MLFVGYASHPVRVLLALLSKMEIRRIQLVLPFVLIFSIALLKLEILRQLRLLLLVMAPIVDWTGFHTPIYKQRALQLDQRKLLLQLLCDALVGLELFAVAVSLVLALSDLLWKDLGLVQAGLRRVLAKDVGLLFRVLVVPLVLSFLGEYVLRFAVRPRNVPFLLIHNDFIL